MGQALDGKSILVVADEPLIALAIAGELEGLGAIVSVAASCEVALAIIGKAAPSAAIVDGFAGDPSRKALDATLQAAGVPVVGLPPIPRR